MTFKVARPSQGAGTTPTKSNLDTKRGGRIPVQIRMDVEVAKDFKDAAHFKEMSLSDLFVEMFDTWRQQQSK